MATNADSKVLSLMSTTACSAFTTSPWLTIGKVLEL